MTTRATVRPAPVAEVHAANLRITPAPVTEALVLAAGRGSRLGGDLPKPAFPLLGTPLLARTLFTLERAGVTDAYIVVGCRADEVRRGIEAIDGLGLRLHWLFNERWDRPNGWSVLAAEGILKRSFLLAMGDHMFGDSAVETLLSKARATEGVDLLVDHGLKRIRDLDEATKVRLAGEEIVEIGKPLRLYDAVDTGLFLATPALFGALRECVAEGRETLSDGVQRLADAGLARAVDGGAFTWHDVDTPKDAAIATRKLLADLRSSQDGPIARWLNRPISTRISRLLANTSITPNHASVATLLVGFLSAFFAAVGGYEAWLASGLLFQLASVLDGVDGEIARLTFRTSRRGEWVDTICDNAAYMAFLIGLTIGAGRMGLSPFFVWTGVLAIGAAFLSLANINYYLLRERTSGSARAVEYDHLASSSPPNPRTRLVRRLLRVLQFFGKRDGFAFSVFLLAVAGLLPLALPLFGIGATLVLLPVTVRANLRRSRRFGSLRAVPRLEEE